MVRGKRNRPGRDRFRIGQPCGPVVGEKARSKRQVDDTHADQRLDISRIERQGTLEKPADEPLVGRLVAVDVQMFDGERAIMRGHLFVMLP
jgi:hypothetical protein